MMVCTRGKANPDITTRYRLFAESTGRCQNPDCLQPLFIETTEKFIQIAEAAHIVAARTDGARGDTTVSIEDRGKFVNLILLCPNCHTTIDKAEESYPVELLLGWKSSHAAKIEEAFGFGQIPSREEAYERLERYRNQNRAIFDTYGPLGDHRFNPESELPALWRKHVLETILPNNRTMLQLMDRNTHLLNTDEKLVVEKFRIHVSDFERRHLQDPPAGGGQQYPTEVDHLFREI